MRWGVWNCRKPVIVSMTIFFWTYRRIFAGDLCRYHYHQIIVSQGIDDVSWLSFGCQPDEPLASLATTNIIINVYGSLVVLLLPMYVVLHCLYCCLSWGSISSTCAISVTRNHNCTYKVNVLVKQDCMWNCYFMWTLWRYYAWNHNSAQIVRFMWPTWGPPGSCRLQVGPMLATWNLLSGPCMPLKTALPFKWVIHTSQL